MQRRNFNTAVLATAAMVPFARFATAQEKFPSKPIRIIVGFPAGQSIDVGARIIAAGLSKELGQSVWVDNKPGASGIIAHEMAKKVGPDGLNLLISSTASLAINPTLYKNLPYDPLKDFTPIALINTSPLFLLTNPSSPYKNVGELISYAKANPGKLSYGSSGSGTTGHIAMEMLKKDAGIFMVHVPYKGSPSMVTDLIAGHIHLGFDSASSAAPQMAAGKLRALGASSLERSPRFSEIPTIAEQGFKGFQALTWAALLGPAGMPSHIVEALNSATNKVLKTAEVQEHYAKVGSTANGGSSVDFADMLRREVARWSRAVRASGATID